MEFINNQELNQTAGISDNIITISHRGEKIDWNIKTFRSVKVNTNLVTDINRYWSRLPMEDHNPNHANPVGYGA